MKLPIPGLVQQHFYFVLGRHFRPTRCVVLSYRGVRVKVICSSRSILLVFYLFSPEQRSTVLTLSLRHITLSDKATCYMSSFLAYTVLPESSLIVRQVSSSVVHITIAKNTTTINTTM